MIAGKNLKRAGKLVGVDPASLAAKAASRDYLVDKLGWPRSVIGQTLWGIGATRRRECEIHHTISKKAGIQ